MKTNDETGVQDYKVYCTQRRGVTTAINSIKKAYPKCKLIKEIKPNANSKNFLHLLKETFGRGKTAKIKITYNFINLLNDTTEEDLIDMIDEIVDNSKNFGSDEE